MRTIGFVIFGLVAAIFAFALRGRLARRKPQPKAPELTVVEGGRDELHQHLSEAANSFSAAAAGIDPDHETLRQSLTELSARCLALAERQRDAEAFGPPARTAIVRLLLALYGVVERVTALARHGEPTRIGPAIGEATALIGRSTEALGGIAEQADETALRHLEAELDVLRARLD